MFIQVSYYQSFYVIFDRFMTRKKNIVFYKQSIRFDEMSRNVLVMYIASNAFVSDKKFINIIKHLIY